MYALRKMERLFLYQQIRNLSLFIRATKHSSWEKKNTLIRNKSVSGGHEKEQFEPKGNKALPEAMDMPVNRNKVFLTMPSEKVHWEVPKSLRKEQEGKSELLKEDLLFLKG